MPCYETYPNLLNQYELCLEGSSNSLDQSTCFSKRRVELLEEGVKGLKKGNKMCFLFHRAGILGGSIRTEKQTKINAEEIKREGYINSTHPINNLPKERYNLSFVVFQEKVVS